MKRGAWACCAIEALLAAMLAAVVLAGPARAEPAEHLTRAERCLVDVAAPEAATLPGDADPCWQPVALPDMFRRPVQDRNADVVRQVAWYRFAWTVPAGLPADTPLVVYVPRVVALPVELWWQRQEGGWVEVFDNQTGFMEQFNRPLLMALPPGAAREPLVRVTLRVPSRAGRYHSLSSVWIGTEAALRDRHAVRTMLQQTLPAASSLALALLGLLSFLVWLGRRGERGWLDFAVVALIWPLRNAHLFVNLPVDDDLFDWFWWMTIAAVGWLMLATYRFAFRFAEAQHSGPAWQRRLEPVLWVLVVAGSVSVMPLPLLNVPMQAIYIVNLVVALAVTLVLSRLAWHGNRELRVMVVALWLCLAFAAQDFLLLSNRIGPEAIYLLPYGALLVLASFLYAALRRFTGALTQAESASHVLAERLAERERELALRHEQLRAAEREQALLLERQRLMRDMHDGVGSHLIALLRLAESGSASGPAMAELLRGAIEDLRLTIDSLEPLEHDLATLLATLRQRVGRRLDGAGLRLEWAMDDLPPLPWLEPTQALQVLRVIQEAMSNAIKHARARTLRLSARRLDEDDGRIEVCVADDGCGFDPAHAPAGHGLASMRQRAATLGGELQLDTEPGRGVRLRLLLPGGGAGTNP